MYHEADPPKVDRPGHRSDHARGPAVSHGASSAGRHAPPQNGVEQVVRGGSPSACCHEVRHAPGKCGAECGVAADARELLEPHLRKMRAHSRQQRE